MVNLIEEIIPFARIDATKDNGKIIFNEIVPDARNVVNLIFLLAKYDVYKTRCMGEKLNIVTLNSEAIPVRRIERYYAAQQDSLTNQNRKWYNINIGETSTNIISDDNTYDYIGENCINFNTGTLNNIRDI